MPPGHVRHGRWTSGPHLGHPKSRLDSGRDPRCQLSRERRSQFKEKLHAAVGFPIRNGVEFLGVMEFFSRQIRQPDNELLQMMSSIGSHISQFIERRHAEKALAPARRVSSAWRGPFNKPCYPRQRCAWWFRNGRGSHPAQETEEIISTSFLFPMSRSALPLAT